jgi:ribosomal protein S18 acetylase RimI-like enzyme
VVSDVVVREGRAGDSPALRRLLAEAMGEPDTDAIAPEDPAGYAAARVDGAVLVVDRVMVAPADRGRHVGHRLLDWLEGYGVSRGLQRVRIAVERENRPARDFYARRGYAACDDGVERDLPHV